MILGLAMMPGVMKLGATPLFVTYEFTGVCGASDCANNGVALLTLQNFNLGDTIDATNFVSFSYSSNLVSFSIPSFDQVGFLSGTLFGPLPSTELFYIRNSDNSDSFLSAQSGTWCAGNNCSNDTGSSSAWALSAATVPEPTTMLLFGIPAIGIGLLRRRRNRG